MSDKTPRFSTEGLFAAKKPDHLEPFEMNDCAEWLNDMAKIGFTVTIVQMVACPALWEQSDFPKVLGEEMQAAKLGHLDSSQWQPKIRHFFYSQTSKLAEALLFLSAGLEKRGLLSHSAIGFFDAPNAVWRTLDPGAGVQTSALTPPEQS
jgi:hypothetical protein